MGVTVWSRCDGPVGVTVTVTRAGPATGSAVRAGGYATYRGPDLRFASRSLPAGLPAGNKRSESGQPSESESAVAWRASPLRGLSESVLRSVLAVRTHWHCAMRGIACAMRNLKWKQAVGRPRPCALHIRPGQPARPPEQSESHRDRQAVSPNPVYPDSKCFWPNRESLQKPGISKR